MPRRTPQRGVPPFQRHPICALFLFMCSIVLVDGVIGVSPVPATAAAYATIDEKTLYIQGGITNILATGYVLSAQFFSLDLKTNWTTSNPPWAPIYSNTLPKAPTTWGHSMAVSRTKDLIIWTALPDDKSGVYTYYFSDNTWQATLQPLPPTYSLFWKLRAVTDPSTGTVYVPSGRDNGTNMAIYNPESSIPGTISMPPVEIMPTAMNAYSAVWSTQRNTILIYGGTKYFDFQKSIYIGNPFLVEFCPRTHTWSRVPTTGASPGDISCHCMVPAYNGTKMVVFGGVNVARQTVAGIYVLDVETMIWTKGKDIDPLLSRSDMACSVAGDNFIAWGGEYEAQRMESLGTPVIYNLKSGQWIDEFIAPQDAASTTTSPIIPSSSKVNVAAAVGGGVSAVVIAILVAFLLYRRRKKSILLAKGHALAENDVDSHRAEEGKFNESTYLVPCDSSSSPRSLSQAAGFQQPPAPKMELQHSPSALPYQQQPSESIVYYPVPSPDSAYPMPPILHEKGNIYHDGDSHIHHQSAGYTSDNNAVRTPPDSRELKRRTNDPQYKPQQGSARVNNPEDHVSNDENEDRRIQRHINLIREQQEKQQQMQQDLERLRLEQQEQLQLLESRLKAKE